MVGLLSNSDRSGAAEKIRRPRPPCVIHSKSHSG